MHSCPSEDELLQFVNHNAPAASREATELHLDTCASCRRLVSTLASDLPSSGDDAGAEQIGRYRIDHLIGRGGMGEVYAATDPELDRPVAVKLLLTDTSSEEALARLRREARAMAQLAHPNVVVVHEVGGDDGQVYIAMELVDGGNLRDWLEGGERGWREILDVMVAAGRGLGAAHALGLIHRDFKPDNVLIGRDGRARITDFGLVQRGELVGDGEGVADAEDLGTGDESETTALAMTRTGQIVGTPAYMAPEQFRGREVDAKSDQFAFCVTVFEALAGSRPYAGSTIAQIHEAASSPHRQHLGSHIPGRIRHAVLRGLSSAPADRFESMNALLDELRPRSSRRHWIAAGAAVAAVAAGLAVALVAAGSSWRTSRASATPGCDRAESRLAQAWGPDQRERLATLGADPNTTRLLSAQLDEYAGNWSLEYDAYCSSPDAQAHRMARLACLEGLRLDLASMVETTLGSGTMTKAVVAAYALPPVESCRRPTDVVEELRAELARARAALSVGDHERGLTTAKEVATRATTPGAKAEALFLVGALQIELGHPDEAKQALLEAIEVGAEAKRDRLVALAWSQLILTVAFHQADPRQVKDWIRFARAAAARADDPLADAMAQSAIGAALMMAGQYDEARLVLERALALREELLGEQDPRVAEAAHNLGEALRGLGKIAEARVLLERALAIRTRTLGPRHPVLVASLDAIGQTLYGLEDYTAAKRSHRAGVDLAVLVHGEAHPAVARSLVNLGHADLALEDLPAAHASFALAAEILSERFGADDPRLAPALSGLASTLRRRGKLREAAAMYERVLAMTTRAYGADHPFHISPLLSAGDILKELDDCDAALVHYRSAHEIARRVMGPDHTETREAAELIASCKP